MIGRKLVVHGKYSDKALLQDYHTEEDSSQARSKSRSRERRNKSQKPVAKRNDTRTINLRSLQ